MLTRSDRGGGAARHNVGRRPRVRFSDNTPLAQALTLNDAAKPYIVVYTDTDNRTGHRAAPISTSVGANSR